VILGGLFWGQKEKEVVGMSEAIIVAIITGAVTLLGVLISNSKAQAVTDTKLEELTREVREHNNFARRMPVVEEKIQGIERRLGDLENKG
jgi:hypothetical protein